VFLMQMDTDNEDCHYNMQASIKDQTHMSHTVWVTTNKGEK